jgi:hypothetical protein
MNIVSAQPILSGISCLTAVARFHELDFSEMQVAQLAAPGPGAHSAQSALKRF